RSWDQIVQLKREVSKALELSRKEKVVGHSLDAAVRMVLPGEWSAVRQKGQEFLQYIFIVSAVEFAEELDGVNVYCSETIKGLKVSVNSAPGQKCERCWNYFVEPPKDSGHPDICLRCVANLEADKA
ncbi:MAG: zinc finger domain-containing protein, partial [Nitrospinales bacterium]